MDLTEFSRLFKNADHKYFFIDTYNDGSQKVYYKSASGSMYDLTSPVFWNNSEYIKHLGLDHDQLRSYDLATPGYKETFLSELRLSYRYKNEPGPDMSWLNKSAIAETNSWGPKEFNLVKTTSVPVITINQDLRNFVDLEKFRVYVSQDEYFVFNSKFPNPGDIIGLEQTKYRIDNFKSAYARVIRAMYVLSYLGGLSLENLQTENPLARSLAHFCFHYFIRKSINFVDFFKDYDTSVLKDREYHILMYKRRFVWFYHGMKMSPDEFRRHPTDVIKNIHRVGDKVYYDESGDLRTNLSSDYKTFLRKSSSGLTEIGQKLLQESTEVYVYSVLAAQVKSRFKIVGEGVKSYQAQEIFKNVIHEKIIENNLTKVISDFRKSIVDSRVRLNFTVSPGMILIPANMKFMKNITGYNNFITVSKGQKFGVNPGLNNSKKEKPKEPKESVSTPVSTPVNKPVNKPVSTPKEPVNKLVSTLKEPVNNNENISIFLTTLLAAGFVKFILIFT